MKEQARPTFRTRRERFRTEAGSEWLISAAFGVCAKGVSSVIGKAHARGFPERGLQGDQDRRRCGYEGIAVWFLPASFMRKNPRPERCQFFPILS